RKPKGNGASQCCVDCRSRRLPPNWTAMKGRGKARATTAVKFLELAVLTSLCHRTSLKQANHGALARGRTRLTKTAYCVLPCNARALRSDSKRFSTLHGIADGW